MGETNNYILFFLGKYKTRPQLFLLGPCLYRNEESCSEVKQKAMKRQGAFSETNGSPKPLPLMQQQDFGSNYYAGRASSLSAEGAPLRKSAKVEWLWQLERETASPALSQNQCHNEVVGKQNGRGGNRSYNPFQPSVSLHHLKEEKEKEASKEQEPNPPLQSHHELDMEVGYEDDRPMLSTLESIDHNFSDELEQLDKQQKDAEDAEHTRHLERTIEISKEYREKRLSLQVQQAEQRRQFLEKEAGEQLQHYHYKQQQQIPAMSMPGSSPPHSSAGSIMGFHQDAQERAYYNYPPPSSSTMMTPPYHHRPHHGSAVNELLYRDRYPQQLPVSRAEPRSQVEGRVPLPAGRVYNNSTAATRYH